MTMSLGGADRAHRERLRFVEFEFRRLPSGGCQARVVLEWSPEQRVVGVAEGIASQNGALRCAGRGGGEGVEGATEQRRTFELLGGEGPRGF